MTVVIAEKNTFKKDLALMTMQYHHVLKQFKSQKEEYALLAEEINKVDKQNHEYRSLIIGHESKLQASRQELVDIQKLVKSVRKTSQQYQIEAFEHKKQVEKLIEELRDKSDSESFDDEKERILNVKKALEADQLRVKVKNLEAEINELEKNHQVNVSKIEGSLNFSRAANQGLKNDYDLLQEKFEKHMKATNNTNQELKEQIEEYLKKLNILQMQVDDHERLLEKAKA